jgi:hypothetical protein
VRFNDGRGNFAGGQSVVVGPYTSSVEGTDVNGDGNLDSLLANVSSSGTVSTCFNNTSAAARK